MDVRFSPVDNPRRGENGYEIHTQLHSTKLDDGICLQTKKTKTKVQPKCVINHCLFKNAIFLPVTVTVIHKLYPIVFQKIRIYIFISVYKTEMIYLILTLLLFKQKVIMTSYLFGHCY